MFEKEYPWQGNSKHKDLERERACPRQNKKAGAPAFLFCPRQNKKAGAPEADEVGEEWLILVCEK